MNAKLELTIQRLKKTIADYLPSWEGGLAVEALSAIEQLKSHQELLITALDRVYKEVLNERDCLYDSSAQPGTGEVPDENDRKALAELDEIIDQAKDAIAIAQGDKKPEDIQRLPPDYYHHGHQIAEALLLFERPLLEYTKDELIAIAANGWYSVEMATRELQQARDQLENKPQLILPH